MGRPAPKDAHAKVTFDLQALPTLPFGLRATNVTHEFPIPQLAATDLEGAQSGIIPLPPIILALITLKEIH